MVFQLLLLLTSLAMKFIIIASTCPYKPYEPYEHALVYYKVPFSSLRDCQNEMDLKLVTTIHIFDHSLASLEDNAFSEVSQLRHLVITQTNLYNLQPNLFKNLKELIHIDLSHNKLRYLTNRHTFESQVKLESLLLSGNGLITLDLRVIQHLSYLTTLQVSYNNFSCDCAFYLTMAWCEEKNLAFDINCSNGSSWKNLSYNTNCINEASSNMMGKSLSETNEHSEEVSGFSLTHMILTVSIVIFVIVAVVIEIKLHCIRRLKHSITGDSGEIVYEESIGSDDFEYRDLNVVHQNNSSQTDLFTESRLSDSVTFDSTDQNLNHGRNGLLEIPPLSVPTGDPDYIYLNPVMINKRESNKDSYARSSFESPREELKSADTVFYAEPFHNIPENTAMYAEPYHLQKLKRKLSKKLGTNTTPTTITTKSTSNDCSSISSSSSIENDIGVIEENELYHKSNAG